MHNDLSNIQALIVSKAITGKHEKIQTRADVTLVGTEDFDFSVRFKGTVKIGADFMSKNVARVPYAQMLAIALSKLNGVTVASIIREVQENPDFDDTEIKEQAKAALEDLMDATSAETFGRVNLKVAITPVAA